jgi:hypothetical protein
MGLTLSNNARSAGADAIVDRVDAGAGPGKLRIYSGTRPASPDTAVGAQVLLAEFTLADPAFSAAAAGVKTLDATPVLSTTGLAAGAGSWCRFLDSNNVAHYDGSVTATGGGGNVELNTTTVSVGLTMEITAGTITMPPGTP